MNETADNIAKHTDEVYLRGAELEQHRGIKHTFREKQLYKAVLIAYKPPALPIPEINKVLTVEEG